jgi:hypothetical protein
MWCDSVDGDDVPPKNQQEPCRADGAGAGRRIDAATMPDNINEVGAPSNHPIFEYSLFLSETAKGARF